MTWRDELKFLEDHIDELERVNAHLQKELDRTRTRPDIADLDD